VTHRDSNTRADRSSSTFVLVCVSGILTYLLLGGRTPFSGSTHFETLQNVRNGNWTFGEHLAHISPDAKDFISRLLVSNQDKRLSSEQASNHPWLKYALQHVESTPISSDRLQGAYSRQLYDVRRTLFNRNLFCLHMCVFRFAFSFLQREHRRISMKPLPKISELLSMKDDSRGTMDEKDNVHDDRYVHTKSKRTSRGWSLFSSLFSDSRNTPEQYRHISEPADRIDDDLVFIDVHEWNSTASVVPSPAFDVLGQVTLAFVV
jgi:serine/threonine protein kinase